MTACKSVNEAIENCFDNVLRLDQHFPVPRIDPIVSNCLHSFFFLRCIDYGRNRHAVLIIDDVE
jgi:hypothetical protein